MGKRAIIVIAAFAIMWAVINFPLALLCGKSRLQAPRVAQAMNVRDAEAAAYGWPARTVHATPWPPPTGYVKNAAFGYRSINATHAAEVNGALQATHSMEVELTGWPLPCIERVQMWWPWNDPAWSSPAEPDPKLRVYWPGALGNPAMIGVGVWLVFVLPFEVFLIVQRRRRIRQRACLACGYPAGNSPTCSECGAALPASVERKPAIA